MSDKHPARPEPQHPPEPPEPPEPTGAGSSGTPEPAHRTAAPPRPPSPPAWRRAVGRGRGLVSDRLEDWERTAAVAIGLVTLTAALLTYLAVLQDDASSEARGQATVETLQLERQELVSAVRLWGEEAAADRYRRSLAEAEALETRARAEQAAGRPARAAELQAEAHQDRYVADSYQQTTFDAGRLSGTTAGARYDTANRLETIQQYGSFENIGPDQPKHTAHEADRRHDQSVRTLLCVVLLLVLVIVLTVGRILATRRRPAVLALATLGWAIAVVVAVVNSAVG